MAAKNIGSRERESMEYKTFKEEFKQRMEKELGEGIKTSFQNVERNNREMYEGLEVGRKEEPILAILPLGELYGKYRGSGNMEQTVCAALKMLEERPEVSADMVPRTWESARGNLRAELMHYEWNRESLENIPHRRFLNLAVAYRIELPIDQGCMAGIRVNGKLMELWGVTEEKLHDAAMENLRNEEYRAQSMTELLGSMAGLALNPPEDTPDQYVLTNAGGCYGAAGMLREDILESFAEQSGGSFYLLPSSIHELILVPEDSSISAEGLKEMVEEVNKVAVAREEWLSESVYYYDCKEGTLRVA